MKKRLLKLLRGPLSRLIQLMVFVSMAVYLFTQVIHSLGNKMVILDQTEAEEKIHNEGGASMETIESVRVYDEQQGHQKEEYSADKILKKWRDTALMLSNDMDTMKRKRFKILDSTLPPITSNPIRSQNIHTPPNMPFGFHEQLPPKKEVGFGTNEKKSDNLQEYKNNPTPSSNTNANHGGSMLHESMAGSKLGNANNNKLIDVPGINNIVDRDGNIKHDQYYNHDISSSQSKSNDSDIHLPTKTVMTNMKGPLQLNHNNVTSKLSQSSSPSSSPYMGISCKPRSSKPRMEMRGTNYWALYNYIPADESFKCNETITYTTHGELTFLHNLAPLLRRWKGPVSIAVYTPGTDYSAALEAVFYYRQCDNSIDDVFASRESKFRSQGNEGNFTFEINNIIRDKGIDNDHYTDKADVSENRAKRINKVNKVLTGSELVRKYVTFHFYFPVGHHHPPHGSPILTRENGLLKYQANCDKPPPNANQVEVSGSKYRTKKFVSYRYVNNLTYPVNVGRNIARQSATSHFVFASDIELYPSPGLIPRFLKMISRQNLNRNHSTSNEGNTIKTKNVIKPQKRVVYVNAIFELQDGLQLPETKFELVKLLTNKKSDSIS